MSDRDHSENRLLVREWVAVALIGAIIFSLGAISWRLDRIVVEKVQHALRHKPPHITLVVEGAVEAPGVYHFPPGVSSKEVIKALKLKKNADRKKIKTKRVYYSSDTLIVPPKITPSKKKKVERNDPS